MGNSGQEGCVVSSELGQGEGQESGAAPAGDPASPAQDPDSSPATSGMAFAASAGPVPTAADPGDPWSPSAADAGPAEGASDGTDPGSAWKPSDPAGLGPASAPPVAAGGGSAGLASDDTDPGSAWKPSDAAGLGPAWAPNAGSGLGSAWAPPDAAGPGSPWAPPDAAGPGSAWAPPAPSGPGPAWGHPAGQPAAGYPAGPQPGAQPPFAQPAPYSYPGQAQPGYPGGPARPANAGWPGGAAPRPKIRRGVMLAVTAVVAAVVAGAVTGIVLLLGKAESPTTMALQSGRAIAPAAGLTLTGNIAGQSASLTVTRSGAVEGTYTQNGYSITRLTIGSDNYLKAPASFWLSQSVPPDTAQQAAAGWAKAPATTVLNVGLLTPGRLARTLEHVGSNPSATTTTLGGTKVIKLTDNFVSYFITASAPNRLVRVEGEAGTTSFAFDVNPLSASSVGPAFTVLHGDVRRLRGAVDPAAVVRLLQKVHFHANCGGPTLCTVSNRVSVTDPDSPTILLRMTVDFSARNNGPTFATCTDTVSVAAGGTVSPTCHLGGAVWAHWVNSHSSNFFTWAVAHFVATVNSAKDVAAMQSELNQQQGG
jgi:hypothetical protein